MVVCEVRQTYGCAKYEPAEDEQLESETNDSVVLRCAKGSNTAWTWTLNCVDGQWTAYDGQIVDCRANNLHTSFAGSVPSSSTDLGNRGI